MAYVKRTKMTHSSGHIFYTNWQYQKCFNSNRMLDYQQVSQHEVNKSSNARYGNMKMDWPPVDQMSEYDTDV